jgi:hypothetical protein
MHPGLAVVGGTGILTGPISTFLSCLSLKYSFLITGGVGIGLTLGKILSRKDL